MTDRNYSRPVYEPLEADTQGTEHWLVASGATGEDSAQAVAELSRVAPLEVWAVRGAAGAADGEPWHVLADTPRYYDNENALVAALDLAMRDVRIGIRIYALGSEPFIWSVRRLAQWHCVAADAVRVAHSGSRIRRVYCIHCRHFNEAVTSNVVRCGGCGRDLFVRDHFSKRLAAFMGVQADAEVPGELPAIEHLYQ